MRIPYHDKQLACRQAETALSLENIVFVRPTLALSYASHNVKHDAF